MIKRQKIHEVYYLQLFKAAHFKITGFFMFYDLIKLNDFNLFFYQNSIQEAKFRFSQ